MPEPIVIKNPNDGSTFAILIKSDFKNDGGISFFTPDDLSQQLAYMNHPKGHKIVPHVHVLTERSIQITQETLVIKSGSIRVDFYDNDQNYVVSTVLNKGDVILLVSGGHGFEVLEDLEMYEIKQGPYVGENDKVRFANEISEVKYIGE